MTSAPEIALAGRGGRIARIWRAWVSLLSERESGLSLALLRVGIGCSMLVVLGTMAWARLVDVIWVDASDGGIVRLGTGGWLVAAIGGPTKAHIWTIFVIAAIAGLAYTVGLVGRASAFVALQAYEALFTTNNLTSHGFDVLITNALWISVLGDTSRTLSVDAWLRTRRFLDDTRVSAWPRYIAIFQLVVMYLTTGLQKLSPVWTPFGHYSALYWVLQDPDWRRWDGRWAALAYPLTQLGTFVSWTWEVTSPVILLVLYYRRTKDRPGRLRALFNRRDLRFLYLGIGVVMHLVILLTLNVGAFSFVALSFYVTFFRPDEVSAFFARARSFQKRARRAEET